MVDLETPPKAPTKDKTTRSAALWAAAFAVPIAVLAGLLIFARMASEQPAARPAPAASTPAAVPSAPVPMAAPQLDAETRPACLAVTSQLPTDLRALPPRRVSAGPEQNAAWGEPPITLACGVPQPVMCEQADGGRDGCVPLTDIMLRMDGVCWWGQDGPALDVFTTMDREVAVRVSVPGSYENPAQWANEFSDAVARTVKSRATGVPSGCN
ncbi:DUF3515 domain-containing protein [Paractinoplanes rishiriensis]|uniref:DUF3515 domain-containing protein n=1 Tax=Paractinoplanes rishiriensis TaxID=1050105 RepID=A0A919MSG7_9ACTN|nr:DUF3515 domain-containing protein [Actinoplanes rishiriensis]GIE93698.1 hypothetical protein Ari01nite_11630 [Actinoplanes rishiriensis]